MIIVSLKSIKEYLTKNGFPVQLLEKTGQLYFVFQVEGKDFPLFIKIAAGDLIQIVSFIPTQINERHLDDTSRLLHHLNNAIDLPGFGMDEANKVFFYRLNIPSHKGKIAEELLDIHLTATRKACETFAPVIAGVNFGAIKLEQVINNDLNKAPS